MGDHDGHHGDHGSEAEGREARAHRDCHAPPQWVPQCPCGCRNDADRATPGARLGAALPPAEATLGPTARRESVQASEPRPPIEPLALIEPIPIRRVHVAA